MIRLCGLLGLSLGLRRFGLLLGLAWCLGCGRGGPEERLRLSGIESPVISAETALEIVGEALPTGERLVVELRGVLSAVGQDARSLEVSLLGHVLAPERLSVAVDAELLRRWGRAGFDGERRVSGEPSGSRRCRGALLGVRLDFEAVDPRGSQRQRHVVEQLLPALGVTVSDSESMASGVVLAELEPGSLAAHAGLRPGDRLLRSNGVSLRALSDLAPGPSASALLLHVQRASGQVDQLRLSLASAAPLADPRTLGLCVLACPALLLLLGFLPVPTPGAALSRLVTRGSRVRSGAVRRFGFGALACVLSSAVCVLWQPPDAFWLLSLQLGCVLGLHGLRRAGWGALLLDVLGLWLAAASAAAISGTRSWGVIVHDQLGGAWAWNALSRPVLLLALGLTLVHAVRLHARPARGRWELALEGLSRALICVLCVGMFLGGSQLHTHATFAGLVGGALAASAKALICYALLITLPKTLRVGRSRG